MATPRILSTFAATIALSVLASPAFAQNADVTYVDSKGRERTDEVTIESHTFSGLEMKMRRGGAVRTVNEDEVLKIVYSKAPEEYTNALGAWRDGDVRGALGIFEEIIADERTARSRPWARENAMYYMWLGLRRIGAYDDAGAAHAALAKDYSKSHWIPKIKLQEAWDQFGIGDMAKAKSAFTSLAAEAESRKYAPSYAIRAGLGAIRAQLAGGDVAGAATALQELRGKIQGDSMRNLANALEGHIFVAQNDYDRAMTVFNGLVERLNHKTAPIAYALAANGLGECAYAQSDFRRAALAYSRTFALCRDLDGTDEDVGWAFWRFANASRQLAGTLEDEGERRVWLARHRSNRRRAAESFRHTRGGRLALRELGN